MAPMPVRLLILSASLVLAACPALAAQPSVDMTGVWIGARSDPKAPYKDSAYPNPPPFTEQGKAQSKFWAEPRNNLGARCIPGAGPVGTMGGSTFFPIEIIQKPGQVTILDELMQTVRRIYVDGRKHPSPDDLERSWMGHSIGHWDGNVLVVDTIGLHSGSMNASGATVSENTLATQPRMPYSESLHLTERIHMLDGGKYLEDDVHIDDPTIYTKPIDMVHYWRKAPELEMLEYICTETLGDSVSGASADKPK